MTLARLLLVLAAVALTFAVIAMLAPYAWAILWALVVFTPLFTWGCWLWRQRLVRDEATRPFAAGPAPEHSVTRSLERPVVPGRVLARSDVRVSGKVEA